MNNTAAQALIAAGTLTAVAAVAHLACIAIGARAYRFMGAGERMARAVEAGKLRPTLVTLAIAAVLLVWTLYAFSGAGTVRQLPFTGLVLPAVAGVFLARGVGFPLLRRRFPENSMRFWLWSSGICLVLGLLYAIGSIGLWGER